MQILSQERGVRELSTPRFFVRVLTVGRYVE